MSLRNKVIKKVLKAPTQHGFSEEKWKTAFTSIPNPTEQDKALLNSALLLGSQLAKLRSELVNHQLPAGPVATQLRRAIALANRECLTAQDFFFKQQPPEISENTVLVNSILESRANLAGGLNSATLPDIVEGMVDGLRFELFDINSQNTTKKHYNNELDALKIISMRANLAIMYCALEEQWLNCLHCGYTAEIVNCVLVICPKFDEDRIKNRCIGHYRQGLLEAEHVQRFINVITKINHGVMYGVRFRKTHGKIKLSIDEISNDLYNELLIYETAAMEPDIEPYFSLPLKRLGGITCNQMLSIWKWIASICPDIADSCKWNSHIKTLADLETLAPIINRQKLIDVLAGAPQLGLSKKEITCAISNLTWRNVRDSIWHRPLIPTGSENQLCVVLSALQAPNLKRSVEYWLQEGGFDLDRRGTDYESSLRKKIKHGISKNQMLSGFVNENSIMIKNHSASEEIDLIIVLEKTILVGEIKCLLRPATAHELFQFEERISEGAIQAKRKAKFISENKQGFLEQLGEIGLTKLDPDDEYNIQPCLIINTPIGSLRTINDVPVVDEYILYRYFTHGYASMFGTIENEKNAFKAYFYKNKYEAADNLKKYLHNPDHLVHLKAGFKWSSTKSISFCEDKYILEIIPQIDVTGVMAQVENELIQNP